MRLDGIGGILLAVNTQLLVLDALSPVGDLEQPRLGFLWEGAELRPVRRPQKCGEREERAVGSCPVPGL